LLSDYDLKSYIYHRLKKSVES